MPPAQAEGCGYELHLAANQPGQVCFELRRRSPGTPENA